MFRALRVKATLGGPLDGNAVAAMSACYGAKRLAKNAIAQYHAKRRTE